MTEPTSWSVVLLDCGYPDVEAMHIIREALRNLEPSTRLAVLRYELDRVRADIEFRERVGG